MGKSTLIKAAGRFFDERNKFDSIIYFDFKQLQGSDDFEDFLVQIYEQISQAMPTPPLFFMDCQNKV
jgi:hypothetical protein